MTIEYPVRGVNQDDEDLDGMIVDATGRALDVDEIVAALNNARDSNWQIIEAILKAVLGDKSPPQKGSEG